ncbi:hypothetical protein Taro_009128 [Colocasia esculenta]|uniref:Cellulose synthase-like protein H1 n=1 Tax=Colocasia esculenta TaxID=4460 RepID=A0A843U447_COLES|nr:hypothetical protein [Colocasia esculenta]
MPTPNAFPLQERIPVGSTLKRVAHLAILSLLVLLLLYRLSSLPHHGLPWLLALLCEAWFTFVWLLNVNAKWNPVIRRTHPAHISKRCEDLPAVDMFVTTADPVLEPPIVTVNTVLSLLAIEYPAHKLACYVSDDACSPLTYHALVEASEFAKSWVPFCRKNGVGVRAPCVYFSREPEPRQLLSPGFLKDWELMKDRYEQLREKIEEAGRAGDHLCFDDELSRPTKLDRGGHPSTVKFIWENKANVADGIPHLIYVAREKRPRYPHHYKAGAMNVLTRVSGVITNAPFMLNVDCDSFANNPQVILHAMCLLLGFEEEAMSGFVQCPQKFHGGLKDDPFGNQFVVAQLTAGLGMDGLQGPFYLGTGCVHRRKVIYGAAPNGEFSAQEPELERKFGSSRELKESAMEVLMGASKTTLAIKDLSSSVYAAQQVASCTYEFGTSWGEEVGFVYGSTTEDVQTGLRIHGMGWSSVNCSLDPPGFLGNAPVDGPASMTQIKRWSTGLLEVVVGRNSPLLATLAGELRFRQCLCYLSLNVWALRSLPELCYALLPPYCVMADTSFLPKVSKHSQLH